MIHVFIGTKAQYIKTAPVLRALEAAGVPYRLIDSGQHAQLMETLRPELGIRAPDCSLRQGADINRIDAGFWWMGRHLWRAWVDPAGVRAAVFGGTGGVCLIHGDTGSTLLAAYLARRAGLRVAHLEAGLRSGWLWDPFPEEVVRRLATRMSDVLLAPSARAAAHLRRARVRGAIVELGANTGAEAAAFALTRGRQPLPEARGFLLVTIHRLETITRRRRLAFVADAVLRAAARHPVVFVLHEPTRLALQRTGVLPRLASAAGVRLLPLQPYAEFLQLLAQADGVITDGGSVQEECAYLGAPCLVLRARTERPDGVGENVTVAPFDAAAVDRFTADPSPWRRPPRAEAQQPSRRVVEVLRAEDARAAAPAPGPRARWSVGWCVSLGVCAWLVWLIVRAAARVTLWPSASAWRPWTAATLIQLAATGAMAWLWARLAQVVGVTVPTRPLMRVWAQALPAKYIPGKWWQVAGRWYLAKAAGAPAAAAMLSIVLEQAYIIIACLLLLLAVWWTPMAGAVWHQLAGGWWFAAVAASVAAIPWWLPTLVRWIGRRMGLALDVRAVPARRILLCGAGYFLYWIISLTGLAWWVRGWPSVTWPMAATMALTYVAAFLVGCLCPWAPAGLGVRESAFAWGIAPLVGTGPAVAIAVSTRLWFMGADLLASLGLRWLTRAGGDDVSTAAAAGGAR